MGKEKKERKKSEDVEVEMDHKALWVEKIKHVGPISQPLAPRKLTKRLYKVAKKAANQHNKLRKGVRDVQKYLRKGEKGICIIAGDVSPIDVISHLPYFCEESGIPYCYTPSKEDLGAAFGASRHTTVVLIKADDDYREQYDDCYTEVSNLPMPL